MQAAVSHRVLDRIFLVLMVSIVAVPIAYLELDYPGWKDRLVESVQGHFQLSGTNAPVATSVNTQQPTAPPVVAPKTATTVSYVHVRSAKSTSSSIVTDLPAGTAVTLRDEVDATWQGVTYQGKPGFIYRSYLQY